MIAVLGLLVLAPLPIPAQTLLTNRRLYDAVPKRPEHYERRVAEFATQPAASGRVVFLPVDPEYPDFLQHYARKHASGSW